MGIDEANWFGTHDHAIAEEAAGRSMAALVGRIIGAKPFPMSARRLAELTRLDVVRIEPVIQVLETDPGLSARLLRLVNSAGYALRQRCTSVRHAATLVGTDRLHQIATTAAVLDLFDSKGPLAAQIIEHSTVVGAFCRYLGAHMALPVDDLFTAGFLHDIGKLMLMETEGDQYVELLTRCASQPESIHYLERQLYGFDHASLAAHVLSAWNIPDPVPKIVGWHHEPAQAYKVSSLMASLVQTVRLSDAMVYAMRQDTDRGGLKDLAKHEAAGYLEISEPQLAAMWDELRVLFDECRQQCLGENAPALDPRSLRPRQPISLSVDVEPTPSERAHDLPKQFPCVECGCPTFGNTCPACNGYVCPDHQVGSNAWCAICARDYQAEKKSVPVPLRAKWAFAALGTAILLSGLLGMLSAGSAGALRAAFGTLLLGLLAGLLYLIGKTWLVRTHFVRSRPNRFIAEPQSNDGGTQSLVPSMNLDSEDNGATSQSVNWLKANIHLVEPLKEITIREISASHTSSEVDLALPPDASIVRPDPVQPAAEACPISAVDPARVQLQSESLVTLPAPAHRETPAPTEPESCESEPASERQWNANAVTERSSAAGGTAQWVDSADATLSSRIAPTIPSGHHPLAALGVASQPLRAEPAEKKSASPPAPIETVAEPQPTAQEVPSETECTGPTDVSVEPTASPPNVNAVAADELLATLAGGLAARFGGDFESQVRELAAQRVAQMIAERFMAAFDINSLVKQALPPVTSASESDTPQPAAKPRRRKRQA
jgi:HD-like signal output (HDOD) protein